MSTYRIHPVDVIEALKYVKEKGLDGLFYPNATAGEFFELKMSEDDMVMMKLSVPCRKVERL